MQKLPEEIEKTFKQGVNLYIDFSGDKDIINFYEKIDNWDVMKNLTEMVCFAKFLGIAKEHNLFKDVDRIFKISGRYHLTDSFDISKYDDSVKDKIVFKTKRTSQFAEEITGGVTLQHMSRLWSFDSSLHDEITENYKQMIDNFINRLENRGYIDIEHSFYKFMDPKKIVEFNMVGVTGNIAPNGVLVED